VSFQQLSAKEAASFLQQYRPELLQNWSVAVREAADIPHADQMPEVLLLDSLPYLLLGINAYLEQAPAGAEETFGVEAVQGDIPESHAQTRLDFGYDLPEVLRELNCLRVQILRLLQAHDVGLRPEAALLIHTAIDTFAGRAAQSFLAKRVADQAQAASMRERFIAILGHDLRNPLTTIRMSADLILQLADEPEARFRSAAMRSAARISTSAIRMTRMIQDVMDVVRSSQGAGIPLNCTASDLVQVSAGIVDELAVSHPDRRVEMRVAGDLHGFWDPSRLQQAIENLLSNALQYSSADADVQLDLTGRDTDVQITVHNAGPPIDPAELAMLFEPFKPGHQPPLAGSRKPGLGLGLFIVKSIVQAHGGTIDVTSTPEAGTTFTITLPRTITKAGGIVEQKAA
jgi:signal transduction histidine kinase